MYRNGMLTTLVAVLAGVLAPGATAAAAPPITASFNDCPTYPGGDRICSGTVPSFDGAKLDVDLTLPSNDNGAKHPLIVMLHGFGNDKHEWESTTDEGDGADKLRWNNHWFARHGYYVLNYTARGFRTDDASGDQPATPPGGVPPGAGSLDPPSGTIHIKSREFEVRDTQWLSALVAASYPGLDPDAVAVTGGSYGGGESWLQASQPTWDFPHSRDASLPVLQLQVAVAKYPWTDLAYALAPNGHGADPYATAQGDGPTGVPKASYIAGLFASGNVNGAFEEGTTTTPSEEGPINIPAWNTRLTGVGDPYPTLDPVVAQAKRGLTEFRSAYYQPWSTSGRKVAVFSIQGWTDDLFEAVESFRMYKLLKAKDPQWPVEVALGDVGHSRAQNKPQTWQRLNAQAFQWLQSNIGGSHDRSTTISSEQTTCDDGAPAARVTAKTPEDLSAGSLSVGYAGGGSFTNSSGAGDPDGRNTDAILGGSGCKTSQAPTFPGRYTGTSAPLGRELTYVGLGTVTAGYTLSGRVAELAARVWDVAPDGTATLVTRGVYRFDSSPEDSADPDAPAGTVRLPLYGNHWRLAPGHRLRLDLAEVDAGTFRPTNSANTLTITDPTLTLPTRSVGTTTLAGAGSQG